MASGRERGRAVLDDGRSRKNPGILPLARILESYLDRRKRPTECGANTYEKRKFQPGETSDGTTKSNLDKKFRGTELLPAGRTVGLAGARGQAGMETVNP